MAVVAGQVGAVAAKKVVKHSRARCVCGRGGEE